MPNKYNYNLSDEEIIKIVTRARQTTLKEAAAEFGIPESFVTRLVYIKAKTMNIPDTPVAVGSLNPTKKPASDFTFEEKQAAVNRTNEVGLHQAAKEYSVKWQTIVNWKRVVSIPDKKQTDEVATTREAVHEAIVTTHEAVSAKSNNSEAKKPQTIIERSDAVDTVAPKAPEAPEAPKPAIKQEETRADKPQVIVKRVDEVLNKNEVLNKQIESLKIENALLKDKIETLSRQLEKLTRAIGSLTQLDVKLND